MDPGRMSGDINASFLLITNSFLLFLVTLHLIIKARHIIVENVKYKEVYRKKQQSRINPHLEADPISTLLYILSTLRLQCIYYFVSPFCHFIIQCEHFSNVLNYSFALPFGNAFIITHYLIYHDLFINLFIYPSFLLLREAPETEDLRLHTYYLCILGSLTQPLSLKYSPLLNGKERASRGFYKAEMR